MVLSKSSSIAVIEFTTPLPPGVVPKIHSKTINNQHPTIKSINHLIEINIFLDELLWISSFLLSNQKADRFSTSKTLRPRRGGLGGRHGGGHRGGGVGFWRFGATALQVVERERLGERLGFFMFFLKKYIKKKLKKLLNFNSKMWFLTFGEVELDMSQPIDLVETSKRCYEYQKTPHVLQCDKIVVFHFSTKGIMNRPDVSNLCQIQHIKDFKGKHSSGPNRY